MPVKQYEALPLLQYKNLDSVPIHRFFWFFAQLFENVPCCKSTASQRYNELHSCNADSTTARGHEVGAILRAAAAPDTWR